MAETRRAVEAVALRFVHAWGSLAHTWGISRAMGEIHAYLYVSEEPRCTDEIMAALDISRGCANTNLRELEQWRLVRRQHKAGDRKDYYVAEGDPWTVCWTLLDERKRREVDPMLTVLRACLEDAPTDADSQSEACLARLSALLGLFEELDRLYEQLRQLVSDGGPQLLRDLAGG